jgi:hypothetical protein
MAYRKDYSWKRTGKIIQRVTPNQKGVITLAVERNSKGWTKEVMIGYNSVSK